MERNVPSARGWGWLWQALSSAQRVMEINSAYLAAFFDKHLRVEPAPLLAGPAPPTLKVTIQP